jgi:hypothetical protein
MSLNSYCTALLQPRTSALNFDSKPQFDEEHEKEEERNLRVFAELVV